MADRWRFALLLTLTFPALSPLACVSQAPSGPLLADYPQFLGPDRDASLEGPMLARDWQSRPPEELWRRPIGEGWSAFAVAGQRAVTQEQHGELEKVVAYDLLTGERLWEHSDRERYETDLAGVGPRATPAIAAGRVFTVGGKGRLNALDLQTGELLWTRNDVADLRAFLPRWGKACSPLVVDDLVIVSVGARKGRSLMAFRVDTGEVAWSGGSDRASYSSPLVATLAGVRQVVIFNRSTVAGHALDDGRMLWRFAWPQTQPNVAQPLVLPGDRLLLSCGYDLGSKLLQITPGADGTLATELVWESRGLKAKFTNLVLHEGYVYGLDDGIMACLDPETGERCWKGGRYGHGQILLVGDLLLVQMESGELALVEPDPRELRELARVPALPGRTWNNPALAGQLLLLRNHQEAVCLRLPLADEAPGNEQSRAGDAG